MITDLLIAMLGGPISWIASALPSFTVVDRGDYTSWINKIRYLNYLLPLREISIVVTVSASVVIGLWAFKWLVKIVDYIADVIP